MTAHARLSPSAASIWMNCPAMPTITADMEGRSSEFADRGSMAHHFLELGLNAGYQASAFLNRPWQNRDRSKTFRMDQEDCDAVQVALDWIRSEVEEGDEFETETRLKYSDDLWGTCDFSRYRPDTKELLVVDYKHGAGVPVEAEGNPQGLIYALMKIKSLGNRGLGAIRFAIIQPRCFHEDGPVREFTIDGVDSLEWEDRVVAAMEKIAEAGSNPGAYINRGKHCRWCKANFAGGCPAVQADLDAAAELDFSGDDMYDPAKLGEALAICERAEAAIKATREFAYTEIQHGQTIPGWKMVAKRPTERWADADGAADLGAMLGLDTNEIYKTQVKAPAQLRAVLEPFMDGDTKKARAAAASGVLAQFTEKVSSGTTLVPESDPRPPARDSAETDFDPME